MQLLERIWADIRRGENIDLYVTVIVAIGVAALNLFGFAPVKDWIAPLTLAVLGLLAFATLGNRYKTEEVLTNLTKPPSGLFQEEFPISLQADLERSQELWLVGVSLSRTIKTYYSLLERNLARGASVKVLLLDPDGTGCEMSEKRVYGRPDIARTRATIRSVLSDLCELQKNAPSRLEIRTLDFPLGFGGLIIDPDTTAGILYLEHYPFKTGGGALPKLVLQARDGRWYSFFKAEVHTMWESGTPWKCGMPEQQLSPSPTSLQPPLTPPPAARSAPPESTESV